VLEDFFVGMSGFPRRGYNAWAAMVGLFPWLYSTLFSDRRPNKTMKGDEDV
jgi:hypothetical protein